MSSIPFNVAAATSIDLCVLANTTPTNPPPPPSSRRRLCRLLHARSERRLCPPLLPIFLLGVLPAATLPS
ncbi:hypothetical protein HN51_001179, partial [Arachis hypogaea]